jgi:hypothetical protein
MCRRPNLRSACCLHDVRLGPPPLAIRTAQEPRAHFPQAPERPSAAERENRQHHSLARRCALPAGAHAIEPVPRPQPAALCLHAAKRGSLPRAASVAQEPRRHLPQAPGQSNALGSRLAASSVRQHCSDQLAVISSQRVRSARSRSARSRSDRVSRVSQ